MMTFEEFQKECDLELQKAGLPLSIRDLADARWRDYYDDGMTPRDAIECANDETWDGELSEFLNI